MVNESRAAAASSGSLWVQRRNEHQNAGLWADAASRS